MGYPSRPMLRQRAAMGQHVHTVHQAEQLAVQPSYRAEVVIQHQMLVDAYTVHIPGTY